MQISQLRSLLAIQLAGSLSRAAEIMHLSHSAISVQMKQLEAELGADLFIKGRRPATLTPLGETIAQEARDIVNRVEALGVIAGADEMSGRISLGFVPTTLETLLPMVLDRLRQRFPELQVTVRSGLSAELARSVEERMLDFAFISAPVSANPAVRLYELGNEPLVLITAKTNDRLSNPQDILAQNPYVAFNRGTWLGQLIDGFLTKMECLAEPTIELDSIDAIETLVAQDFGVSVVPRRLLAPPLENRLRCLSPGMAAPARRLVLISAENTRRGSILKTLKNVVRDDRNS